MCVSIDDARILVLFWIGGMGFWCIQAARPVIRNWSAMTPFERRFGVAFVGVGVAMLTFGLIQLALGAFHFKGSANYYGFRDLWP